MLLISSGGEDFLHFSKFCENACGWSYTIIAANYDGLNLGNLLSNIPSIVLLLHFWINQVKIKEKILIILF